MSDGPTHSKTETLRYISKGLKVPHQFTLHYCSWSSVAVGRLGKELFGVFCSFVSELRIHASEWLDLSTLVQSAFKHAPSSQRRNIAPITTFTGMQPSPPVQSFFRTGTSTPMTVTDSRRHKAFNIDELLKSVANFHHIVDIALQRNHALSLNSSRMGSLPNLSAGD